MPARFAAPPHLSRALAPAASASAPRPTPRPPRARAGPRAVCAWKSGGRATAYGTPVRVRRCATTTCASLTTTEKQCGTARKPSAGALWARHEPRIDSPRPLWGQTPTGVSAQ
eukprot:775700-Pleurochrysis_carterae.AAC.1